MTETKRLNIVKSVEFVSKDSYIPTQVEGGWVRGPCEEDGYRLIDEGGHETFLPLRLITPRTEP